MLSFKEFSELEEGKLARTVGILGLAIAASTSHANEPDEDLSHKIKPAFGGAMSYSDNNYTEKGGVRVNASGKIHPKDITQDSAARKVPSKTGKAKIKTITVAKK